MAKLYAYWITVNYREAYGIYACNGILFNHESPVRGETFVTRKITRALARIKLGLQDKLYLGNLNARARLGPRPRLCRDAVADAATGQAGRFRDCDRRAAHACASSSTLAAKEIGIDVRWQGDGVDEKGYDVGTGKCLVEVDPRYFRPAEVETLLGDASKAKQKLGWTPKTSFKSLVTEMMREDLASARRDELVKAHGFKHYNYNE